MLNFRIVGHWHLIVKKKKKDHTEFIELVIDILSIPENNTINREIILMLNVFLPNPLA